MSDARESPAQVAELLALYRRTHYDVDLPQGGTATLRIGAPPPADIAAWIGADAYATYLTACNPQSQALPPERNAERMAALRKALSEAGARWLEGRGSMPGEDWSEPSLLVAGLALEAADRIARSFEQNASVRIAVSAPARLRLHRSDWRARVAAAADLEHDAL
jgi:hypothetical protein